MSVQAAELLYGRGTLKLTLPENADATVISKPPFPAATSAAEVFAQTMADPVDCESLDYREAQGRLVSLGPDACLDTLLAQQLADVDEWQTQMHLKPMRTGSVGLYTTGLAE